MINHELGKGRATKSDRFSDKIQTAFNPSPHFRNTILQFFMKIIESACNGAEALARRILRIWDIILTNQGLINIELCIFLLVRRTTHVYILAFWRSEKTECPNETESH